jgi:mRNA-degrading endonuclease RelE of RelBE toxin-antitoxin system
VPVYQIFFTTRTEREFRRLPASVQLRFARAFAALADDPLRPRSGADIRQLSGGEPRLAIRVGDYRAIYEIRGFEVRILKLARRAVAYR